jgi:hypothetical protein
MNYNFLILCVLYAGCFSNLLLAAAAQFQGEQSPWKAETAQMNREAMIFCGLAMLCLALTAGFFKP